MREQTGLVEARRVVVTPQARKDARKLARAGLRSQAERLLALLGRDLIETPPRFERLVGDLAGASSRRINIQHRLVYQVLKKERVVTVLPLWTAGRTTTRPMDPTAE